MRLQGLMLTILLGSCGYPASTVVHVSTQPSVPNCNVLNESDHKMLSPKVTRYFLSEVGSEMREVTLHRGSRCEEEAVFLLLVNEMPPRPFFVYVDLKSGEMKLGRPE